MLSDFPVCSCSRLRRREVLDRMPATFSAKPFRKITPKHYHGEGAAMAFKPQVPFLSWVNAENTAALGEPITRPL
jgi:hypothetical protein